MVWLARKACTGCRAACVGLVSHAGVGLGDSELCSVRDICSFCTPKRLVWVSVEIGVKIRRSGAAGEVLAADPGLAVETGPGGGRRRWN